MAHAPAVSNHTPPITLTSCDYSSYAHLRPWRSAAAAVTVDAHAPQTAWSARSVVLAQPNRTQVPSGLTVLDAQRGDDHHAVGAPAQPSFLHDTDYPRHPMPVSSYLPALPYAYDSASSTTQAYSAGLVNVSPCVAVPVPGQAPPPSNRRRYHRRPHARSARPDHVTCDKCNKLMRQQSLRRHVREVHEHIKRPHPKSSVSAGPLAPP